MAAVAIAATPVASMAIRGGVGVPVSQVIPVQVPTQVTAVGTSANLYYGLYCTCTTDCATDSSENVFLFISAAETVFLRTSCR